MAKRNSERAWSRGLGGVYRDDKKGVTYHKVRASKYVPKPYTVQVEYIGGKYRSRYLHADGRSFAAPHTYGPWATTRAEALEDAKRAYRQRMMRAKRNPMFGAGPTDEVFEDEEIAGYRIEQIRSCKPPFWRVSYGEGDDEVTKRFASKGKALVWVGKRVKKGKVAPSRFAEGRPRRGLSNPKRPSLAKLIKLPG
jgi:hypothetical protein